MRLLTMTKTVLRNLFTKPATRRYPYCVRPPYKNTRGHIAITVADCIFCGMCQRRCPTGAITVVKAEKKWTISRLHCTACGNCVEVCPKKCLAMENKYSDSCLKRSEETFQLPAA